MKILHKHVVHWWNRRRERFYRQNRWHLILDASLALLVVLLLAVALRLALYHPAVIEALNFNIHKFNGQTDDRKLDLKVEAKPFETSIDLDQVIEYVLNYENTGNVTIDQAELSIDFISAAFNLSKIEIIDNSEVSVQDNIIILQDIASGDSDEIKVNISWQAEKTDFPRSLEMRLLTKLESGSLVSEKEVLLPDLKIMSDLRVNADLYFHSPQGDQLGIGPVPPIVDIPTIYWLIVKAINTGNDLEDFVFSAKLADNVELSGDQSLLAGQFSYNQDSRRLIWQVDNIKAEGGDYIANFALSLKPDSSQLGKNALILSDIRYHAYDVWTDNDISAYLSNLDSSLPADHINRNNGLVAE